MKIQDLIFPTSHLKVLKFLCEYMGKDFYDTEVSRLINGVSKAAANKALRDLSALGITKRFFIGNLALNRVEPTTTFIREFKKNIYITELADFIEESKAWTQEMYIFGDFIDKPFEDKPIADLLIVTSKEERIRRLFTQYHYTKMLNPLYYTPEQFEWFKTESPTIWEEVQKSLKLI